MSGGVGVWLKHSATRSAREEAANTVRGRAALVAQDVLKVAEVLHVSESVIVTESLAPCRHLSLVHDRERLEGICRYLGGTLARIHMFRANTAPWTYRDPLSGEFVGLHGDFGLNNVLVVQEGFGLIDWNLPWWLEAGDTESGADRLTYHDHAVFLISLLDYGIVKGLSLRRRFKLFNRFMEGYRRHGVSIDRGILRSAICRTWRQFVRSRLSQANGIRRLQLAGYYGLISMRAARRYIVQK